MYSKSIQTYSFEDKREGSIKLGATKFEAVDTDLQTLVNFIQEGHILTHRFIDGSFGMREKTNANFQSACFVSLDVDDCPISLENTISQLEKKPTISYYTASNGYKGNGYRYRLIYVFDEPITIEHYKPLVGAVEDYIKANVSGYGNSDNCSYSCCQCYFGAEPSAEVHVTGFTYKFSDFPHQEISKEDVRKVKKPRKIIAKIDEVFKQDLVNLTPLHFLSKYSGKFSIETHSRPIDKVSGAFLYDKENYIEIPRKWENKKIVRKKDGEKRRNSLYATACYYRLINPSISLENMIYNLVFERLNYYVNSDQELTNDCLIEISKSVISKDIEDIENRYNGRKKKFSIDKDFCLDNNISVIEWRNIVGKYLRHKEIFDNYDFSKTIKDNKLLLEEKGIKTSISTLKRFLKSINENNIKLKKEEIQYILNETKQKKGTRYSNEQIGEVYDIGKSVTENVIYLNEMGMNVKKDRLYRFCRENGIETNPKKEGS